MNLINFLILFIMAMSAICGAYNGSIASAISFASYIFSWLVSWIFYPLISKLILIKFPNLINTISLYIEGASKIPIIEDRTLPISTMTSEKLASIVEQMNLPYPFDKKLLANFKNIKEGIGTLADYVDYTLSCVIINIASFLLLFFIIKLLITIILSIRKTLIDVPVLKRYELLSGAGVGLLNSMFILYFLFALMSTFMTVVPPDILTEILAKSRLAGFFYRTNIFTGIVRGVI